MEPKDWFASWFESPYYRILYQDRDKLEAQAFLDKLIAYLHPMPGSNILDIACGEGRFAIQLAEKGFEVTGIDLSHANIEKAKANESNRLHFYVHDMRMPMYINYFDYAFNFFTSFGYFAHDRDHMLAARSFAGGLKKDGILVIDYLNSEYVLDNMSPEATIQRGSYTFHITKRVERGHIVKDISFTDADNRPRMYTESVAAFSLSDFIRMFKIAGMRLTASFGDYNLDDYDPSRSPRMILVFKKVNFS